jgi:hypothetical protein
MTTPIRITHVSLQPGKSLDLRGGHGTTLTAMDGNVWITLAGDRRDIILQPGQSFVIDRDGLTVASALGGSATVTVVPVQASQFDVIVSPYDRARKVA